MTAREARPARDPSSRSRGLDIGQARVRFRDRSVLDVLDLSLRFITEHGLSYAKVALVTILPPLLVSIGAGYTLGWGAGWLVALCLAAAMNSMTAAPKTMTRISRARRCRDTRRG